MLDQRGASGNVVLKTLAALCVVPVVAAALSSQPGGAAVRALTRPHSPGAALGTVGGTAKPTANHTAHGTADDSGGIGAGPLPASFQSLESLYLDRRPPIGPVHVVDIGAGDYDHQILMESLAGLVNRNEVQIYTVQGAAGDPTRTAEEFWINEYESEGLVDVADTEDLDQALSDFKTVPSGYIEIDDSEPWLVNAATTLASVDNALIVTPETLPEVQAVGLPLIADLRGRWTSAAQCYQELDEEYASQMSSQDLGILNPTTTSLRDFLIQQGIFTMYAHPVGSDWAQELPIISSFPSGHPVYGYLAQSAIDEFLSTLELSQQGKWLVPSDDDYNLSFQISVEADQPTETTTLPANLKPCSPVETDVIPVVTDGDNIGVDTMVWERTDMWGSSSRGTMDLGWSISPVLSFLSPGVWDYYMSTKSSDDEFVAMMGDGYAFPSAMPGDGGAAFYQQSFELMSYLGLHSYWSLDLGLAGPSSGGGLNSSWSALDDEAEVGTPSDVLLSYFEVPVPLQFSSPTGIPAWTPDSLDDYNDTASQLSQVVQSVQSSPPSTPTASFLPIPVWNFTIGDLISTLEPLSASGVRYLTPSQASACVSGGLPVVGISATPQVGYRLVSSGGVDYTYGSATNLGSPVPSELNAPIVASVATPDGHGYWEVSSDGGVFTYGDAGFYGSAARLGELAAPVVGMVATADGHGYWEVSSDGGVFTYGDAGFYGSAAQGGPAPEPVVAMVATSDDRGYWLIGQDGSVFSFGDAASLTGSQGASSPAPSSVQTPASSAGGAQGSVPPSSPIPPPFRSPIVAAASTPDGGGLWLVAANGAVSTLGDATGYGDASSVDLSAPVVGIAATPDGKGYWIAGADGGVFAYGDAPYLGSVPGG